MRHYVCQVTGLTPACEDCLDRQALAEVAAILGGSASMFACRGRNLVGTYVALADVARGLKRVKEAQERLRAARDNRAYYVSRATHRRAMSSMVNTLLRRDRELLAVMAGLSRERYTEFPR